MSDKLIISAAVCGSSPTKEQNPKVPYTPEEIAGQALDAGRAGAAAACSMRSMSSLATSRTGS